jgi:hypothetical protein
MGNERKCILWEIKGSISMGNERKYSPWEMKENMFLDITSCSPFKFSRRFRGTVLEASSVNGSRTRNRCESGWQAKTMLLPSVDLLPAECTPGRKSLQLGNTVLAHMFCTLC